MKHLVLAHGLNNTPGIWDAVVAELKPRLGANWHIHCPAMDPLESTDAVATRMLEQLPERFTFVGFSFGGYVGMAVLAAAAERLEGFSLVCSSSRGESEAARPMRLRAIEIAQGGGYEALMAKNHPNTVHPDRIDDPEILARREAMIAGYGVERFVAHMRACLARPDRTALLAEFEGPRLLVAAQDDKVVPATTMREIAAEMPAVPLVTVEHCGHLLPLERPAALAHALAGWLAPA
jgi:pimeloyl-ACP methyl ester carboxylesterase